MIVKNLYTILFFLGAIAGLHADGLKSVTIRYIGETDAPWEVIVINTWYDGSLLDTSNNTIDVFCYFVVQESTFDEIINLIDNSSELFGEREWNHTLGRFRMPGFGALELYIKNEEVEYYRYLMEKNKSVIFLSKLIKILEPKENNNKLTAELKAFLRRINS